MEEMFTVELNETELDILNDVLRKHKINVSLEEMALVQLNKQQQVPILSLLYKVAGIWEKKQAEKKAQAEPEQAADSE